MKKTIFALALVLGATGAAFAEDSSTAFSQNVYGPAAQGYATMQSRNVALTQGQTNSVAQPSGYDRASSSYGGGSF